MSARVCAAENTPIATENTCSFFNGRFRPWTEARCRWVAFIEVATAVVAETARPQAGAMVSPVQVVFYDPGDNGNNIVTLVSQYLPSRT